MLNLLDLPPGLRSAVDSELDPQETILWFQQPSPMRMVRKALPILIFAVPWTGIAGFMALHFAGVLGGSGSSQSTQSIAAMAMCLVFLLFGMLMLFAPYGAHRHAKKSGYVVTDRRAISIEASVSIRVRSFGPDKLHDIERIERDDGSGDLILARETYTNAKGETRSRPVGFYGIPDVREVEAILRDVVEAHRAGA